MVKSRVKKTKLFEQYESMINFFAWRATKLYHLEFEEVQAQCYLLFCEAMNRFDRTKGSPSTFFYISMKPIYGWAWNEKKKYLHYSFETFEPSYDFDAFSKVVDLMEFKRLLSSDAKELLDFLLEGEWDVPEFHVRPSFRMTKNWMMAYEDWTLKRTKEAFAEVKKWWHEVAPSLESA